MHVTKTVLPPRLTLAAGTLFASQDRVYALDTSTGAIQRTYDHYAIASPSVIGEMMYLNTATFSGYGVVALRIGDGALEWRHPVPARLNGTPAV